MNLNTTLKNQTNCEQHCKGYLPEQDELEQKAGKARGYAGNNTEAVYCIASE